MTSPDTSPSCYVPPPSKCERCGKDKVCLGCDDIRPTAEDLHKGWRFRSPLGRWETVTRVEQAQSYGPVRVWTDKTGPDYSWQLSRLTKVRATPPDHDNPGEPEIRIIEYGYARNAPIYAVLTNSHVRNADLPPSVVVQASHTAGQGWTVVHWPGGGDEQAVEHVSSKAKARSALRAAARQHAKALKIPTRKVN